MTCGPYRPITLTTYDLRIQTMIALGDTADNLSLKVKLSFDGYISPGRRYAMTVTMKDKDERVVRRERNTIQDLATLNILWPDLGSRGAELWWPVGYGAQNLYTVEAEITLEACDHFFFFSLCVQS